MRFEQLYRVDLQSCNFVEDKEGIDAYFDILDRETESFVSLGIPLNPLIAHELCGIPANPPVMPTAEKHLDDIETFLGLMEDHGIELVQLVIHTQNFGAMVIIRTEPEADEVIGCRLQYWEEAVYLALEEGLPLSISKESLLEIGIEPPAESCSHEEIIDEFIEFLDGVQPSDFGQEIAA